MEKLVKVSLSQDDLKIAIEQYLRQEGLRFNATDISPDSFPATGIDIFLKGNGK